MSTTMKTLGDVTAIGAGYATVDPQSEIFSGIHAILLTVTGQPETTNEILKMVVGLLIGLLSKFAYAWLDKKFTTSKAPAPIAPVAPEVKEQPQTLNINDEKGTK